MKMEEGRSPIVVAVDGMGHRDALSLIDKVGRLVWGFKFNDAYHAPEFEELVYGCRDTDAKVFIDLKLHDIPNTVANTVRRVVTRYEPDLITVHASGGIEMMKAAVRKALESDDNDTETNIVAVTVLTSLDRYTCNKIYQYAPYPQVTMLADMVREAKCWGIVCSPKEVAGIHRDDHALKGFDWTGKLKKIVPGIRPEWYKQTDDQSRVGTPAQAMKDGADLLVIGRAITKADDPLEAVRKTAEEIADATLSIADLQVKHAREDVKQARKEIIIPELWSDELWSDDGAEGISLPSLIATPLLTLAAEAGALQFGEFTLKSGRVSPYFFNAGMFTHARHLSKLGKLYATIIRCIRRGLPDKIRLIAGPAYKGIPLAISTARSLDAEYLFDRKEMKEHGDAGGFVGRLPRDGEEVIVVDDVITTGVTKIEFVRKLEGLGAKVACVVVALDRQECMAGSAKSAVHEFQEVTGIPVAALATFNDLIEWYGNRSPSIKGVNVATHGALETYREEYGVE